MTAFTPTERTKLKRLPKRGKYDHAEVFQILDEAFICHVGFNAGDKPVVIPTSYARIDDDLYIHGSAASRMLQSLENGIDVCVTVTLIDGLVLARSAFHHSMNYRSVVVLGRARLVTERDEKLIALQRFTDHVVPGRWAELRPITDQELKGTAVLALPIEEASAKVRTGPPLDDDEDLQWPAWAGVVPLVTTAGLQYRIDTPRVVLASAVQRHQLGRVQDVSIVEQSFSPFVKLDLLPFEKVRLVTGARGDIFTFDVKQHVNTTGDNLSGTATRSRPNVKANLVVGPWAETELYANFGTGFHSNDARAVIADPVGRTPNVRALPPMHMPGTMEAAFGRFVIRYFIERNDGEHDGSLLTFLRIGTRW